MAFALSGKRVLGTRVHVAYVHAHTASERFLLSLRAPAPVAQSHLIVWVICNSNQGGTTWQSGRARFQTTPRLSHLSLSTSPCLPYRFLSLSRAICLCQNI